MSMSLDTAQNVINDQEDAIAELKSKLLAMEDARDIALHQALELVQALKRIQCANDCTDSWERVKGICQKAIDDFQGK